VTTSKRRWRAPGVSRAAPRPLTSRRLCHLVGQHSRPGELALTAVTRFQRRRTTLDRSEGLAGTVRLSERAMGYPGPGNLSPAGSGRPSVTAHIPCAGPLAQLAELRTFNP